MHAPVAAGAEVAVVVPAFRQPGFLPEAIESVLRQDTARDVRVVVVDDGCPYPETRTTALAYARAHPGRVCYLRRPNGGLSAARNTGIDFALAAWPGLRALYMLDADNRLLPGVIERSCRLLEESPPETGWVYPDFDMFGVGENWSTRGDYSLLLHLAENYCEAGSLVRREVFARGLRFDERMRAGFEDWDLWLQAAEAGFRGRQLRNSGFLYRRRMESMLTGSERERAAILAYMQTKHAALLKPQALLALGAWEMPPFALHRAGIPIVEWRADLTRAGDAGARRLAPEAARQLLLEALEAPGAAYHPPVTALAAPGALEALEASGLLRGLAWQAQHLLLREDYHAVAVHLRASAAGWTGLAATRNAGAEAALPAAPLVFARGKEIGEASHDANPHWFATLASAAPEPRVARIDAEVRAVPQRPPAPSAAPAKLLVAEVAALRTALVARRRMVPEEWRADARTPRVRAATLVERQWELGLPLPHVRPRAGHDIGFVLPVFSFGGVERVVAAYAAVLRAEGYRPHLFVTLETRAQLPAGSPFESLNFLGLREAEWPNPQRPYFGATTSGLQWRDGAQDALGMLCTMDAVLNTHSLAGHAVAARLRRLGVKTYVGLHVTERGGFDEPAGNPHMALGYEHAYDGFVVISEQLRAWCRGQAVPEAKLLVVPNAPGYAADPATVERAVAARRARTGGRLRVLYLGRLDAQKGLDRLAAVVRRTEALVDWRLVGRAVVDDTAAELAGLHVEVEPPVHAPAALDALYAWADVVVLTSRYEGVPLTVLEAQRMGCVVLSTDVGAVREVVADGVDGILVPGGPGEAALANAFVGHLAALAADPGMVRRIGLAGAERLRRTSWAENMRPWLDALRRALTQGRAAEGTG